MKAIAAAGLMCLLFACKGKDKSPAAPDDEKAAAKGVAVVERVARCKERLRIEVAYPGASASEVEQGVVLAVEEAVKSVKSVRSVHSYAVEGGARIAVEIEADDPSRALSEVKIALDRITTLPEQVERPILHLEEGDRRFVLFVVHGPVSPVVLSAWIGLLRDRMLQSPSVREVATVGRPAREILVDAARDKLDAFGVTPEALASAIRTTWLDAKGPAHGSDLADVAVPVGKAGKSLRLGDVATLSEGVSAHGVARLEGHPAVLVAAFGTGDAEPGAVLEEAGTVAREHARPEIKMRVMGTVTIAGCGEPGLELRGPVLVARVRVPGADAAGLDLAAETALGLVRGKGDGKDVVVVRGGGLLDLHALTPLGSDSFELVGLADSEPRARQLAGEWRSRLAEMAGAEVTILAPGDTRVTVELAHEDMELLTRAESDLRKRLSGRAQVLAVGSSLIGGKPEISFKLSDRAAALGVTPFAVAAQMRSAAGDLQVGLVPVGRDHLPVVLRVTPAVAPADLSRLPIALPNGKRVPLGEVATIERGAAPAEIYRRDLRRAVVVYAILAAGKSGADLSKKIRDQDLPALIAAFPGLAASAR